MTRLIVAGTGLIGHRHLQHIVDHPNLTLAGIVDPNPDMHALADVPGFLSLDDVDIDADGLIIATPTATHAPLTYAATARGWPVLVEKPIAGSLHEADAIVAAAETTGVPVLVGHHRRHHPKVRALKKLLASGRLGQPVTASLLWTMKKPDAYFDPPWRQGREGAPVLQNMIHEVDTLRWLFGDVTACVGFGSNAVRSADRTESGAVALAMSSGVTVTIAFADTTPTPWGFEVGTGESPLLPMSGQDCLRIACTKGAVEFPSLTLWEGAESWTDPIRPTRLDAPEGVPLVNQLEHFARVIRGEEAPLVTAAEGRATLAATLMIEEATLSKQAEVT